MEAPQSRRSFLKHVSRTAAAAVWLGGIAETRAASGNSKLNLGVIGVANRGGANLEGVKSQNIAALCDVDDKYLAAAAQKFPRAKTYHDFRRLMDQPDLDAVVIATPDHTHAVAAVAALQSGRHLYCEKPLTRTISECRIVTELAKKQKRVTQLGTQIHAGTNYRRVVELIQSGAIGSISEVHVFVRASNGGMDRPTDTPPVPDHLHYDLWLGPVEYRPYSPLYHPNKWRNWWAFGGGALADFGCHYMDLPHWALGLRHPISIQVVDGPPVHPDSTPPWLIVRYEYPARENQPPVSLIWHHGGKRPQLDLSAEKAAKWPSGVLFVGERGKLLADYNKHVLLPEKDFKDYVRPAASIPNSIGHHQEWIEACKTGGTTTCHFDYSGPLTEAALLGNVAFRAGKKLEWDPKNLKATNCPEADAFLQHHYREGWKI
ncbi:MAG: Gfo/Idh/MocA family oxidoreductase [Verrucomicrobia bacterium]|nr:Gfo/Idh/MocA family oxidoreductase [Verrucomicrobiota bacterium]